MKEARVDREIIVEIVRSNGDDSLVGNYSEGIIGAGRRVGRRFDRFGNCGC